MKLKITIENKVYEVDVEVAEEQAPVAVRYVAVGGGPASGPASPARSNSVASGGAADAQPDDEAKACRSPLAGVVSEVKVAAGEEVTADQPVLVLEAMKMFTTITSPAAGKVKCVHVEVAQAVKQGQLLIEFE